GCCPISCLSRFAAVAPKSRDLPRYPGQARVFGFATFCLVSTLSLLFSALERFHERLPDACRRRRHPDARALHGCNLAFRITLAAGNDGAGVAHRASLRSRAARDEAGHRLLAAALGLVDQELGGIFLGRAADLADHDDRLG